MYTVMLPPPVPKYGIVLPPRVPLFPGFKSIPFPSPQPLVQQGSQGVWSRNTKEMRSYGSMQDKTLRDRS